MEKPRLAFITQRVDADDPVLGFVHGWVVALAEKCEQLAVFTLRRGRTDLPPNVDVTTLPDSSSRFGGLGRALALSRLLAHALRRDRASLVIAHMCPEYAIVAAPWCRLFGSRLALWYAHGRVSARLRVAAAVSDVVLTSTPEGFDMPSRKKRVVGQGIDVDMFRPPLERAGASGEAENGQRNGRGPLRVAAVARLSPAKGQDVIVEAMSYLHRSGVRATLSLVGGPLTPADMRFRKLVLDDVRTSGLSGSVALLGPRTNPEIPGLLADHDVFAVMSSTGSLDKSVLEAMAMAMPVVGYNSAWTSLIPDDLRGVLVSQADADSLAQRIGAVAAMSAEERRELGNRLRAIVVKDHSLRAFTERLLETALSGISVLVVC